MSLKSVHLYVAGAMALSFLAACGDDVTNSTVVRNENAVSVLSAGEKLSKQKCDSLNAGELLFVVDSSEVYLCNGDEWETLKGETGAKGDKGKTGAKGDTGEKGKNGAKGDDGESLEGSAGPRGATGAKGLDGTGCNVVEDKSGVVTVACGSDTTTLYRAVCGDKPYDVDSLFCVNDELYDPSEYFVDDRDNQVYRYITVKEGKKQQVWMAENLNFDYNKGSARSMCYEGFESNCDKYGRLYTWSAAMDSAALFSNDCKGCGYYVDADEWVKASKEQVRGVCPAGWHIPDTTEFAFLLNYVSDSLYYKMGPVYKNAGKNLKAKTDWTQEDGGVGVDSLGFSILPTGYCTDDAEECFNIRKDAFFWTTNENVAPVWSIYFSFDSDDVMLQYVSKVGFESIRCVKD